MVYFPEGHPKNHGDATAATITLDPKLDSISPNSGTSAGTLIRAQVPGVTVADSQVQLVDSAGVEICQTVSIVEYGVLDCTTKQDLSIASGS
jgi:hypothetical protein